MNGYFVVALALASTCLTTLSGWRIGLCSLLGWGYFHGILKAHLVYSGGHFIFDGATIGFYLGLLIAKPRPDEWYRASSVKPWVFLLISWSLLIAVVPLQHYLIQLVGLRGNIFWHPMILVGAMIDRRALKTIAYTLSGLNLIALGFGLGEYFFGVEAFVPQNDATDIVFNSVDIAGGHMRIPSIFMNAHSYGGGMVASMPWIFGEWFAQAESKNGNRIGKVLLVGGLISAGIGVFMAGPRTPIVFLSALGFYLSISGKMNWSLLFVLGLVGLIVGFVVTLNERFQRFTELADTGYLADRLSYSLNLSFLDVLQEYPMGNGMGGGGSSIPFFLQHLLTNRLWIENEWARIVLEQGVVGLVLLFAFFSWIALKKISKDDPFNFTKNLLRFFTLVVFATSFSGTGLFSSLPGTAVFLLGVGYVTSPIENLSKMISTFDLVKPKWSKCYLPAYQRGLARV